MQKGGSIVDEQTETSALASSHGDAVCRRVQPIQSKREKAVISRVMPDDWLPTLIPTERRQTHRGTRP